MSVVISTAYMDEAQRWDWIVAMDAGRVLSTGTPAELMKRTGTTDLEHCFIALLPEEKRMGHTELAIPPRASGASEIAIEAAWPDLPLRHVHRIGPRHPVDRDRRDLRLPRLERLRQVNDHEYADRAPSLPPKAPAKPFFGSSVDAGSLEVRKNLGYMTQAFSLYGELSIRQNLVLHARLYHLAEEKAKARIDALIERFGLGAHVDALAEGLPMGLRQRLSLAVAVLHEPQILILDEPTSGVDPVAWIASGAPDRPLTPAGCHDLCEDALHELRDALRPDLADERGEGPCVRRAAKADRRAGRREPGGRLHRLHGGLDRRGRAARREEKRGGSPGGSGGAGTCSSAGAREAISSPAASRPNARLRAQRNPANPRDPVRLASAFVGSGNADARLRLRDHQRRGTRSLCHARPRSVARGRMYLEQFASTPEIFPGHEARALDRRSPRAAPVADDVSVVLEVPPSFGKDFRRGGRPEILAEVDGAMTFRGDTIAQYVKGVHNLTLSDPASGLETKGPPKRTADIEERYMYNPTFESIYSIVPSVPALLLLLIPAILMTVSIVREKELGSMINFYVTPTGRLEYLLGKQIPYVAIGMMNFFILTVLAITVFAVPIKGSFLMLTLCTLLYLMVTTGIGMVTSTFTSSQVAAVFVTAILTIVPTIQFSGLLQPVLDAAGQRRGSSEPSGPPPTTCTPAWVLTRRGSRPR